MAQTFTALTLSAATNGRPIKIVATSTPGTTIHTATDSDRPDGCDEVWLWAGSTASVGVNGTLQIGQSGDDGSYVNFRVPPAYVGPIAILAGHRVLDGLVITATASVAERINIWGNVNRVSQQTSS
jgi:hypothetical protein